MTNKGLSVTFRSHYSEPRYYDIGFNILRKMECDFLEACFRKYATMPIKRVLDIACGTGQHLFRMARRGYSMTGLDLSKDNLVYIQERANSSGLAIDMLLGDMVDFQVPEPFDAAICLQDSQGHLLTNDDIIRHFRTVARSLRKGGLYIFDRMIPNNWANPATHWCWTRQQGKVIVRTVFKTLLDLDEVTQVCREEIVLDVMDNGRRRLIRQTYPTRVVFPQELRALIQLAGSFEFVAWHPNFHIHRRLENAKHPIMIVAVLRRC
jgi:2-polyprenyl-3-methyl-5-hydroxy-6-metoxy-1,4-benzoquinol methylase